jgi:purine nucleosidase
MPQRLLVDTDCGVDDALAILLALAWPNTTIAAITTVSGNVDAARAARNVLIVLDHAGAQVPVHAGAMTTLAGRPVPPRLTHGRDGLGDLGLPEPRGRIAPGPGAAALREHLTAPPGGWTLVALGPLTNVALALRDPRARQGIARLVVMGGVRLVEFNLRADPDATAAVLRTGAPLTLVGLELSRGAARLLPAEIAAIDYAATPRARLAAALLRFLVASGRRRFGWTDGAAAVPDAVAMAVALDPRLALATECAHVEAVTADREQGALAVAQPGGAHPANAAIVRAIDTRRFRGLLVGALQRGTPV